MENHNPMYICYNTPFKWGENDCCLMAANYHLATTGVDCAFDFRGKYSTAIQAYRLLSKAGGMEAILFRYGFTPIANGYARTGDVALHIHKNNLTMGIVNGDEVVFAGGVTVPVMKINNIYRKKI